MVLLSTYDEDQFDLDRLRCGGVRREGGVRAGPALRGLGRRSTGADAGRAARPTGIRSASASSPATSEPAGRLDPVDDAPAGRAPASATPLISQDQLVARRRASSIEVGRGAAPRRLGGSRSRRPPPPGRGTAARPPTGRRRRVVARPLRARKDRSAGSSPARASWVGKTPRVSSRSASSAALVLGDQPLEPVGGRPCRDGARAADRPGSATRCGRTSREIAASRVAAYGVVGLDDPGPRLGQLAGRAVELGDVAGELGLQRGVAEGDRRLVGERLQQPLVRGAAARPCGMATSMLPSTAPSLRTATLVAVVPSARSRPRPPGGRRRRAPRASRSRRGPRAPGPAASATAGSSVVRRRASRRAGG